MTHEEESRLLHDVNKLKKDQDVLVKSMKILSQDHLGHNASIETLKDIIQMMVEANDASIKGKGKKI